MAMRRPAKEAHDAPAPSYGIAALVGLGVFALYVATLAPTTAMWDASEYITAAYTLGIPHPPGNPLFVLLGRVASLLPFGSVAVRVNLLAALCSAISAGIWFLVAERVLAAWSPLRWTRILAAVTAAVLSATVFTVWNQSVVNEKVYTVSLAFFAIVSWLTVLWCDDPDGTFADRLLVIIAYLIGLGYTNHPAGLLVGPAVTLAVIIRRPATIYRWKLIVAGGLAFALGLTPFAVEPIRAAWHPAMNEGEPTGCADKIGFKCTFSETTRTRLMSNINRDQYGKPDLAERQAPFTAQVGMWWLYFKWQWLRDSHGVQPAVQTMLAVAFFLLGVLGGFTHWRYERASFWFFGPLVVTVTLALVYYMNFKYGASQAPELTDVAREVRDRDYFYLWSYSTWSVWAALGLATMWRTLAARAEFHPRRWMASAPILLIGLIPLVGNWRDASRAKETATREWAHDLLNSIEPYGVLVTLGDNDTFPLWYAQEVEGVRPDVTIAVTSLLNTDWYPRGLKRRTIPAYDAAKGPEVYRHLTAAQPATPVFSLTYAQLDSIPEYVNVRTPQLFQTGAMRAIVDPQRLEYGVPTRGDLMVLQLLKDNLGVRPVYIARTSGNYVQALGLEPYALVQGLAVKIEPAAIVATKDTLAAAGTGHIDVVRSRALWNGYGAPKAMIRRGDWVDRPSVGIPLLYVGTAFMLAQVAESRGEVKEAERMRQAAVDLAEGTRTIEYFVPSAERRARAASGDTRQQRSVPVKP
ncbi:MAG: DUF2723 domain-containing protein [Gemmatimonadaceae bacterium]